MVGAAADKIGAVVSYYLDEKIGRLLDVLDETGQAEFQPQGQVEIVQRPRRPRLEPIRVGIEGV